MVSKQPAAPEEHIESNIYFIRGKKMMLGVHLAEAYDIEPEVLDQVIERNLGRFPQDSVLRLKPEELAALKSPQVISNRVMPYAFTGQGAATLSGILFDERAMHEDQEACAPACGCRK